MALLLSLSSFSAPVALSTFGTHPPPIPKAQLDALLHLGCFVKPAAMGREKVTSSYHTHNLTWDGSPHDRQAADFFPDHNICRLAQRVVLIDHDRRPSEDLAHWQRWRHTGIIQVASSHNAEEVPGLVDYGKSLMLAAWRP
jgi:hypothetical protein